MQRHTSLRNLAMAAAVSFAPAALPAAPASSAVSDLAPLATIQTVAQGVPDAAFAQAEAQYNSPLAGSDQWHGFLRQTGRDIVVMLPQTATIQSISIQFKQAASMGVYYPSHVDFDILVGGQWSRVGSVHTVIPVSDRRATVQTFAVPVNGLQTQAIRIRFPVAVWVFARQLHVYGIPSSAGFMGGPGILPADPAEYSSALSPFDGRAQGIRNMLLVYTGNNQPNGTWTTSDFLPMVGYTAPGSTTPSAHMFDTMLFLPYGSIPHTQSGWLTYLQDLFAPGQELAALNDAVGQTNQALGTPWFREKVVLTLPYPAFGDGAWGIVGGQSENFDGTSHDPAAVQAREQAMQWYMENLLERWNSAGLTNLQLVGLYWEHEQVGYDQPGEFAVIRNAAQLAHEHGLPLFWIPFYGAAGIGDWQSFGFDAVWLQPNFIEQGQNAQTQRIQATEAYAQRHGLGVEIELTDNALYRTDYRSLYEQTLAQLAQDGFAGSVSHAFYAGSKLLVTAFNATNPAVRQLYDDMYMFVAHP